MGAAGEQAERSVIRQRRVGQETLGFARSERCLGEFFLQPGWLCCLLRSRATRQDGDAEQAAHSSRGAIHHISSKHQSPIPQTFSQPQPPSRDVQPLWLKVLGERSRVEFGQQNGFAGLNPFWSLKAFLACCGQALSTHHHSASAKGRVARLGEWGWGTKKSFLAEKHLFITTEEEGASWAENTGRAVP